MVYPSDIYQSILILSKILSKQMIQNLKSCIKKS